MLASFINQVIILKFQNISNSVKQEMITINKDIDISKDKNLNGLEEKKLLADDMLLHRLMIRNTIVRADLKCLLLGLEGRGHLRGYKQNDSLLKWVEYLTKGDNKHEDYIKIPQNNDLTSQESTKLISDIQKIYDNIQADSTIMERMASDCHKLIFSRNSVTSTPAFGNSINRDEDWCVIL